MSVEVTEETVEETTEGQEPEETTEEVEQEEPNEENEDDLPDWVKAKLKKSNGEAARYRTQLRKTEEQLANAKTPEEFDAARTELIEQNTSLQRELIAEKFKLPEDLHEFLTATDREGLEAQAAKLQKRSGITPRQTRPGGGLDPSSKDDEELDPRKLREGVRRTLH